MYRGFGRPHVGLKNPEKFGLTYEEVVELIADDKWLNFYKGWQKKKARLRKIESFLFVCPKCNVYRPDEKMWDSRGNRCILCDPRKKRTKEIGMCSVCLTKTFIFEKEGGFLFCKGCSDKRNRINK